MSKFKPVLDGIKINIEGAGLTVPHFDKVSPDNAGPSDVQQVLNELRLIAGGSDVQMEVIGRAISDIETLSGYDFE